jgi:hypothetical protein
LQSCGLHKKSHPRRGLHYAWRSVDGKKYHFSEELAKEMVVRDQREF